MRFVQYGDLGNDSFDVLVWMPTFNNQQTIAKAIDSVLSQEGVKLRLVVFDDCSTDDTFKIAEQYALESPDRIVLIQPEQNTFDAGQIASRYNPILGVNAQYVATLDADDYWTDSRKLSRCCRVLEDDETVSLVFHKVSFEEAGAQSFSSWSYEFCFERFKAGKLLGVLLSIPTSSMVFRHEALRLREEMPPANFLAQDFLNKLLSRKIGRICYLEENMSTQVIRSESSWSPIPPKMKLAESLRVSLHLLRSRDLLLTGISLRHLFLWACILLIGKLR